MFNQQEHIQKIARCHTGPQVVESLFQMQAYEMCLQVYEKMIKAYPNKIENKIGLAKCYWMMGKFEESKLQFQQALQNEQSFNSSFLAEYVHFLSRDKDEVDQQIINELLLYKVDQDDSDALCKIALSIFRESTTHERHKKSDSIINKLLEKAKELKPNSIEEKYTQAMLCLYSKKVEEGIKLHKEIIDETNDYRSLFEIGQVLLKVENIEQALSYFIRSFLSNPFDLKSLNVIFNLLDMIKDPNLSLKFAVSTFEKLPEHGKLYRGTIEHLLKLNLTKEAINLLKERAEKDENKIAAYQMLAEVNIKIEDWDEAILALEESIKLRDGFDPINYTSLSTAHYNKANYIKSLECLEKSLIQNPEREIPFINLKELRKNNYVSLEQVKGLYNALIEHQPKLNAVIFKYFKEIKEIHLEDFEYMNSLFKSKNDDHDLSHFTSSHTLPDCQKCACC